MLSTQPPKKPAIAPVTIPIDSPTDTETIPISSDSRAPKMMRDNSSRPRSSTPSRW